MKDKEKESIFKSLVGFKIKNRYNLTRIIDFGGMSCVYKGQDELLNRDVAVKIFIHIESKFKLRFKQEAEIISKINHPNCVTIYDFGEEKDLGGKEFLYMVMELLEGKNLKEFLKEKQVLPPILVVKIINQVLDALHVLHDQKIVHRDVKLSNIILVRKEGGVYVPKLIDFGIAKVMEKREGEDEITLEKTILGTLQYMPPEQLLGQPVTPASDIFSIGVILYILLTGKYPFSGKNSYELLKEIEKGPCDIPELSSQGYPIPEIFNKIIKKAVAFAPQKRFTSATELKKELTYVLYNELLDTEKGFTPAPYALKKDSRHLPPSKDKSFFEIITLDEREKKKNPWTVIAILTVIMLLIVIIILLIPAVREGEKSVKRDDNQPVSSKKEYASVSQPEKVKVIIATEPLGLEVLNGEGKYIGITPLVLRDTLKNLPTKVKFKKDKVITRYFDLSLNTNKPEQTFSYDLTDEFMKREIVVESIPDKMEVLDENNTYLGVTPLTLYLEKREFPFPVKFRRNEIVTQAYLIELPEGVFTKHITFNLKKQFEEPVSSSLIKKREKPAKKGMKPSMVEKKEFELPSVDMKEEKKFELPSVDTGEEKQIELPSVEPGENSQSKTKSNELPSVE